jgi:hypothetical protein
MLKRRAMFGGLIALAAPAIIRTPGLLMPIKMLVPPAELYGRSQAMTVLPEIRALEEITKRLALIETTRIDFAKHWGMIAGMITNVQ